MSISGSLLDADRATEAFGHLVRHILDAQPVLGGREEREPPRACSRRAASSTAPARSRGPAETQPGGVAAAVAQTAAKDRGHRKLGGRRWVRQRLGAGYSWPPGSRVDTSEVPAVLPTLSRIDRTPRPPLDQITHPSIRPVPIPSCSRGPHSVHIGPIPENPRRAARKTARSRCRGRHGGWR